MAGLRRWGQHSSSQSHRYQLLHQADGVSQRLIPLKVLCYGRRKGRQSSSWHRQVRLGGGHRREAPGMRGATVSHATVGCRDRIRWYGGPERLELMSVDEHKPVLPCEPYSGGPKRSVSRPEKYKSVHIASNFKKYHSFCDLNKKSWYSEISVE
jgi:hypothetical protein